MVLISVIMPSYNHASYIPEAIESVLEQNFRDMEIIIIDDCSKDKSKDIILSYAEKDERIRTIFHKENLGIAKTYNDGLDSAEGKYVAFLDSDDLWERNKLEKQLSILRRNEDLVVWSEGRIIDRNGKLTGQTFTQREEVTKRRKSGSIFNSLLLNNYIFDSSLITKRKNIDGIRFDDRLKYLNDYKFVVELARNYEYYFIREPLARYRIHGMNTVLREQKFWLQDEIAIREYFLEKYDMKSQTKADMFYRISSAYSTLGEKELARQFLLGGLSQKSPSLSSLLYIIRMFNSFVGTSLLRAYYDTYCFFTKQ